MDSSESHTAPCIAFIWKASVCSIKCQKLTSINPSFLQKKVQPQDKQDRVDKSGAEVVFSTTHEKK